jgi:hypothetical protein
MLYRCGIYKCTAAVVGELHTVSTVVSSRTQSSPHLTGAATSSALLILYNVAAGVLLSTEALLAQVSAVRCTRVCFPMYVKLLVQPSTIATNEKHAADCNKQRGKYILLCK